MSRSAGHKSHGRSQRVGQRKGSGRRAHDRDSPRLLLRRGEGLSRPAGSRTWFAVLSATRRPGICDGLSCARVHASTSAFVSVCSRATVSYTRESSAAPCSSAGQSQTPLPLFPPPSRPTMQFTWLMLLMVPAVVATHPKVSKGIQRSPRSIESTTKTSIQLSSTIHASPLIPPPTHLVSR